MMEPGKCFDRGPRTRTSAVRGGTEAKTKARRFEQAQHLTSIFASYFIKRSFMKCGFAVANGQFMNYPSSFPIDAQVSDHLPAYAPSACRHVHMYNSSRAPGASADIWPNPSLPSPLVGACATELHTPSPSWTAELYTFN